MLSSKLNPLPQTITQSKGLKQSTINVVASAFASIFAAITLMLISRTLNPVYFGQFSTAFAISIIAVKLNDLGLSIATSKLVPSAEEDDQQQMLTLIFRYRVILAGLITVIGLILGQILPKVILTNNPSLVTWAIILSLATALFEHAQLALQAQHRFMTAALLNIGQGMLKLVLILPLILLILQGHPPTSAFTNIIFIVYMAVPALPVILLKLYKPNQLPLSINSTYDNLSKLKKKVWPVLKHAAFSIIAAGIIENIDLIFVQSFLSDSEAGLLGGVSRIALILYVVAYALGNVLNARVARYKQISDLYSYWKKAWMIAGICVLGFVLSMIIAPYLITLTVGSAYLPALEIMRILLGAGFLTIALIPFTALFFSFEMSWYFSVTGILQLTIIILGNYFLVPQFGIAASAWTKLLARGVIAVLTIGIALRILRRKSSQDIEKEIK